MDRRRFLTLSLSSALLAACGAPPPSPTAVPQSGNPEPARPPAAPMSPVASVPPTAAAAQKLTLMLDWFPNTNHSGLYLARDKGWFAGRGVDVEIQVPGGDPSASMKLVGASKAEVGLSYQPAVEIARAQDVPVVAIAALLQHNTAAYAAKASKNITRPKDFEGRKFATSGLPQIEPTLRTLMKCDNADFSKVEMVNVGLKLGPALLADQVDITPMLPAWEGIELELRGNQLSYINQRDFCVPDLYTIVFISSEQTLAEKPEAVRRFLAAAAQGYEYAARNPAEAAETLLKAAPELDAALVKKSQAVLSTQYLAEAPRWGVMTLEQWRRHADWMADNKLIAKPIDAAKAFTNDFLPKEQTR
jgi:ABC-type nitrate/sulfonate/bicarbonate transport system substrate-binding protein